MWVNENHCAVIIPECTFKSEAKSIQGDLPLVKIGNIKFRITKLKPHTQISRLFQF